MKKNAMRNALALCVLAAIYIYMRTKSWSDLDRQFNAFYQQEKQEEALATAKKQLKAAQDIPFLNKYYVPPSLNHQGMIYQLRGEYPQAEVYYQQALKTAEAALGAESIKLVTVLENLARFYRETGNPGEADKFLRRADRIRAMKR